MMKTCYVLGAAPIVDYSAIQVEVQPQDVVICADGGYAHLASLGLRADWLVGDFDSQTDGVADHVIRVKPEKDDTDLQLALEQGITLGYTKFVLIGVLGGRLDHSYATIQLLAWLTQQGYQAVVLDEQNRMTACQNGSITIAKEGYRYLSLFSYGANCHGVSIQGCKYPLDHGHLTDRHPLGVSNEIMGQEATISVEQGILLCIQS